MRTRVLNCFHVGNGVVRRRRLLASRSGRCEGCGEEASWVKCRLTVRWSRSIPDGRYRYSDALYKNRGVWINLSRSSWLWRREPRAARVTHFGARIGLYLAFQQTRLNLVPHCSIKDFLDSLRLTLAISGHLFIRKLCSSERRISGSLKHRSWKNWRRSKCPPSVDSTMDSSS